jgi:hypothetical protein
MTAGQREAAVHSLAVLLGAWLNGRTQNVREMIPRRGDGAHRARIEGRANHAHFSSTVNNTSVFPLVRALAPPARTGRKGRKLSSAFVQVEAMYTL